MFVGYEQIIVSDTIRTYADLTIPKTAYGAQIQAENNNIRYTMDGVTVPTAIKGMILSTSDSPKEFLIDDIRNLKVICAVAGQTARLNIHYYGGHGV